MDSEAEQSTGMSGQIEDLIVDLGNERFMTRHEALNKLRRRNLWENGLNAVSGLHNSLRVMNT